MQKTKDGAHTGGKRIIRNTIFIYGQSIFSMIIGLFTTRIVIKVLGVDDYGVYGLVGGIVAMLSLVTGALQASSSRFFTYAFGSGDSNQANRVFNTSMIIFLLMGLAVIVLGETIGLWFLNTKLNIPDGSMNAARWVYQLSILTFIIGITATPYGAAAAAHEKFDIMSYLGVLNLSMKLGIVYLLLVIPGDKLKVYALLTFGVGIINTAIYRIYCIRNFPETKFRFCLDKSLFKEIFSYSSWNMIGQLAGILKNQGINILINIFFGAALNASRAIAYSLSGATGIFVNGLMGATFPQITKSYAAGDKARSFRLAITSAKLSFFLLLFLAMPVLFETEIILKFWLGQVPEYVVLFVRLILIESLLAVISYPMMRLIEASGNIKIYTIVLSSLSLTILPIGYIVYKLGGAPASIFVVFIAIEFISLFVRMYLLDRIIGFNKSYFFNNVVLPCSLATICALIAPLTVSYLLREHEILKFFLVCTTCAISTLGFAYLLGLSKDDKNLLHKMIKDKIGRKKALEKENAKEALDETTNELDLD